MVKKLFIITVFLILNCANILHACVPTVGINFIILTDKLLNNSVVNNVQFLNEVAIINKYFVAETGEKLIIFTLKSVVGRDASKQGDCRIFGYLSEKRELDLNLVNGLLNECHDCTILDKGAINFFIIDTYSNKFKYEDKTSYGAYNRGQPFVILDYERLKHTIQSPEEHEMGHAFGLGHECVPGARSSSSTNIMASTKNCIGSGGLRNIGFNSRQLEIIKKNIERIEFIEDKACD